MAISDIFKKDGIKAEKSAKEAKENKPATTRVKSEKSAGRTGREGLLLVRAHVTEKSSKLAESGQYVFKVVAAANKREVARAVASYYGVAVVGVRMVNIPEKKKRRARGFAVKPGYRKAIVQLKKGQAIEVMPK